MNHTDISIIIASAASAKVITKTILIPKILKRMNKINYIIGSTSLSMTHEALLALQPKNKMSTYVSFILAAIASLSNTAIISEYQ
jgi:hypothetical protein